MKDKLEKTGHKKGYYRFKGAMSLCAGVIGLSILAAVPIGIAYRAAILQAEEEEISQRNADESVDSTSAKESNLLCYIVVA